MHLFVKLKDNFPQQRTDPERLWFGCFAEYHFLLNFGGLQFLSKTDGIETKYQVHSRWWFKHKWHKTEWVKLVSSVRSSNSHPDLLVIQHPTHFFRSHRSSTLDFHFLSHYSYIKAIMLYKGKTWQDSGILWHTLAYSGILWHTLVYSGILWHTLAYSDVQHQWQVKVPCDVDLGPKIFHLHIHWNSVFARFIQATFPNCDHSSLHLSGQSLKLTHTRGVHLIGKVWVAAEGEEYSVLRLAWV